MKYSFYAVFEYAYEDGLDPEIVYGIYFPDFLGCTSCGDNTSHGKKMAKEALSLHIEVELEDGKILPTPSLKEDIEKKLLPYEKLFKISIDI